MVTTAHSLDEYPITLGVKQVGEILCISETNAYKLMRSKGFPTIRIGRRMIVPRDKLILWMDQQVPPELQTGKVEQPKPRTNPQNKQSDISLAKEFLQFLSQKEAANETHHL